ncbi:putative SUR7 family protein FMP45 [Sclerotinia borealis F-4128]|uniref:Putative SUR7 family protein FMP45 n=1 Tax=Sclerotinia borealis (strain F-4128) TaxID=1432307 RepID=W9C4A4_SCLBF|nr:putative SUR7 family protein FMP45 [Sclerotinia borealis F-4128]
MALTRGVMGIVSLILLGASIMFMFFVILGGVTHTSPLNKTQFLTADTSSISGARPVSQWNYFYVCGAGNNDCGKAVPDIPFGYAWVGGGDGAPSSLIGKYGKNTTAYSYYYMWRFGWVFYLLGLLFTVGAFMVAMLGVCSRLGSVVGSLTTMSALFFFTLGASLMTAEFVKARNQFRSAGMSASIGRYAFGFTWAAWACLFLASIFLCIGGMTGESRRNRRRESKVTDAHHVPVATTAAGTAGTGGGMFGFYRNQRQKRATRAGRSSFDRNESQRRVKDDYA